MSKEISSGVTVRGEGEGGVAGEWRVVGEPKFHSWGKCTMAVTNIHSDLRFNCFLWPLHVLPSFFK